MAYSHLPPTNEKNVYELNVTPSSLDPVSLLTTPCRLKHNFEGINPLWPPLPVKAIKLFFSTSPQTLSSRVNSGQGKEARFSVYFASGNHPYLTLSFCSLNAIDLFPSSRGEHEPQERLIDIFCLFGHRDCIIGWHTTKVRP